MGFALTTDKCHIKHGHSHGGGGGHSHGNGGHSHGTGGHSHGTGGHSHGNGGHSHGSGGHSHGNGGSSQGYVGQRLSHHNHAGMNGLVHVEEVTRVEPLPNVDCLVDNEDSYSPRNRRLSLSVYSPQERSGVNKSKNINVRAAFIHVLGDFIQSIGVFIAALIIKFEVCTVRKSAILVSKIYTFL